MKKATQATLAIAAFCVLAITLTWLIVRWVRRRRYARMSWAREGMNAKLAAKIAHRKRQKVARSRKPEDIKYAKGIKEADCPKSSRPTCDKYAKAQCVKNGKLVDDGQGGKRDQFAWRCKTYQEYCNTNKNTEFYDKNHHECTNDDPGKEGSYGNAGECNTSKGLMKGKNGKCVKITRQNCDDVGLWYDGNNGHPRCLSYTGDDRRDATIGRIQACQANNNNNNKNWWNNDLGKCVPNPNAPEPPPY